MNDERTDCEETDGCDDDEIGHLLRRLVVTIIG